MRGPQVMRGYWNRAEETADRPERGRLAAHRRHLHGRTRMAISPSWIGKKDMIIASGYKILPREVEEVLFVHPKVQEAVVVGVPDAVPGRDGQGVHRAEGRRCSPPWRS